mgnify:CR=1 FL=1
MSYTHSKYYGDKTLPRTDAEIKLQAARDSMLEYTQRAMAALPVSDEQAVVDRSGYIGGGL